MAKRVSKKRNHYCFGLEVSAAMRRKAKEAEFSRIDSAKDTIKNFVQNFNVPVDVITFGQRVVAYLNQDADNIAELLPQLRANEMLVHTAKMLQLSFGRLQQLEGQNCTLFVLASSLPSEREFFKDTLFDLARRVVDRENFKIHFLFPNDIGNDVMDFYEEQFDSAWKEGLYIESCKLEDFDFKKCQIV